jgi:hypothetical protein
MKKLIQLLLISSFLPLASLIGDTGEIDIRQALQNAVKEAQESLSQSVTHRGKAISVLPIAGDQGEYVEGLLKNAVTASGLTYVEGANDPFWDVIMEEVEWDERKEDMLDPETIDKFGKLKSSQWLLYGTVREARDYGRMVYVELELHLSSIETKQHIWGDLVAQRYYREVGVTGIIDLDTELRNTLRGMLGEGANSLKSSARLAGAGKIAMAPIAGDIDGYIQSLGEDMLVASNLMPVRLSANTLGEVRQNLRDNPVEADAILTGAVRDLSRTLEGTQPLKDIYEINAEVQLRIESVENGTVLWSDTFAVSREDIEEKTAWDFAKENETMLLEIVVAVFGFVLFVLFLITTRRSR